MVGPTVAASISPGVLFLGHPLQSCRWITTRGWYANIPATAAADSTDASRTTVRISLTVSQVSALLVVSTKARAICCCEAFTIQGTVRTTVFESTALFAVARWDRAGSIYTCTGRCALFLMKYCQACLFLDSLVNSTYHIPASPAITVISVWIHTGPATWNIWCRAYWDTNTRFACGPGLALKEA